MNLHSSGKQCRQGVQLPLPGKLRVPLMMMLCIVTIVVMPEGNFNTCVPSSPLHSHTSTLSPSPLIQILTGASLTLWNTERLGESKAIQIQHLPGLIQQQTVGLSFGNGHDLISITGAFRMFVSYCRYLKLKRTYRQGFASWLSVANCNC